MYGGDFAVAQRVRTRLGDLRRVADVGVPQAPSAVQLGEGVVESLREIDGPGARRPDAPGVLLAAVDHGVNQRQVEVHLVSAVRFDDLQSGLDVAPALFYSADACPDGCSRQRQRRRDRWIAARGQGPVERDLSLLETAVEGVQPFEHWT